MPAASLARRCLILPGLILTLFLTTAAPAGDSWRTPSGDIITRGMSKAEVLARAGPPTFAEDLNCGRTCDIKVSAFYYLVGHHPNRLAVTLTFRGTDLVRIETAIIR
ncbi:MAG: DUF2845 domain-containing protein [Chromatiales bacterium]|jgi:hypothetical protein